MKGELAKYLGKNREDALDLIALRAKELRILYGLLCILLFALVYEYGGTIYMGLLGESEHQAHITATTKRFRIGDFKNLAKALEPFNAEFPQFAHRLDREKQQLEKIIDSYSNLDAKTLMAEGEASLKSLYSFVTHPAIEKFKASKGFKENLLRVAKTGGIKFSSRFEITPLVFDKKVADTLDGQRNIFEYDE